MTAGDRNGAGGPRARANGNGNGRNGNGRPARDHWANRRRRRRRRDTRARRRRTAVLLAVAAIITAGSLAVAGLTGAAVLGSSCELSSLTPVAIGQNSFVYAADGSLLATIPAERNRQPVPLAAMSRWLPRATVAIEDRRFYEHSGVDFEGIARAFWADVRAGKVVEGASTITMQLVRNMYNQRERTVERKIKEACLAVKLNRAWTKEQILASYLNQVYYGNHAYGVEAAAQTYFSKRARNLTLAEAALIAGLTQAPSQFDPFKRPQDAVARRGAVLSAMLDTGAITRAEYRDATSRPLRLRPGKLYTRIREPYFFSYVRDELIAAYGAETVRSGGLRVQTTIDRRLQQLARQAITDTLYYKDDPASALVAINPANGHIRAMVAVTPGRTGNQFNLAAQARRQAGSTFKTFVLAAAIEKGINPSEASYYSGPFTYRPPGSEEWKVSTYDHRYRGWTSVRSATLSSDNSVYAQLTLDVGPERVAAMARKLGVRTQLPIVPSLGLGSASVSPLEMASAYATLAAGGIYSQPTAIRRVVLANGKVDVDRGWGRVQQDRVVSDGVAYEVTRILEENMLGGTGTAAYFGRPAAGKTGTTDDHSDAWFCGYTPALQATVWIGYPRAQIPMENVHGIAVAGGTFPAQIWRRFMEPALAPTAPVDWREPNDWPEWQPFRRGPHALGGYSYYDYGNDYSSGAEDDAKPETTAPARTTPSPGATAPSPPVRPPVAVPPPPPPSSPVPE